MVIRRTTYRLGGQAVALRVLEDGVVTDDSLYHLHADHLGSVGALTRASSGYVLGGSQAYYAPFGAYRGAPPTTNPELTDRAFTGQRENGALGLYYFNARYYVPGIGRFASADTLVPDREDPQSFNRYAYARNDPLKYIDSDGHCWGAASFIRGWNVDTPWGTIGGGTNCENIDTALATSQHPDATAEEKAIAGAYLGGWFAAGAGGAAGTGLLACSTIALCAAAAETVLGIGTAACADGDCQNEANLLTQAIQNGLQAIQRGGGQGYSSFSPFKYHRGSAGSGQAWHHIVNQNARNLARFGAKRIHDTNNLVKLPNGAGEIHRKITGFYNSIRPDITGSTSLRVREWLELQSFESQWKFGIDTIIRFGGDQYIIDQLGNGTP